MKIEKENNEEKQKLSFLQRWKVRKLIKGIKKSITEQKKYINKLIEEQKNLTEKQEKELEEYKEKLIESILGNPKKGTSGFMELFDITENQGKPITEEELRKSSVKEIMNLTEELINNMEGEI